MKLDRKTLVEYLLVLGLNSNEIAEFSDIPRASVYRLEKEITENEKGLYNIASSDISEEQKILNLLNEINEQLEKENTIENFEKIFYNYRCLQFIESSKKELDFRTYIKVFLDVFKESKSFYDGLDLEQNIIRNLLTNMAIKKAKESGIKIRKE